MILPGASEATAFRLVFQMAEHMALALDPMREEARLLAKYTRDHHALTAETTVTLGQYRQAVEWAHQQMTSKALCQGGCSMLSEAEVHLVHSYFSSHELTDK